MGTRQEDITQSNKDFGDQFNADEVQKVEQTEDEAFGLTMPAADAEASAATTDTEPTSDTVVTVADETPEVGAAGEGKPGEEGEVSPSSESTELAANSNPEEQSQAEKSWEGRLRKREEELKAMASNLEARELALGGKSESEESAAEEGVETPGEEAAENESGEISADEAIKQLSEDFGPDFVKMIMAIASQKAEEIANGRVDEVSNTLKDVIDDIQNSRARRHFNEIYKAHPDFLEVSESEGFKKFIDSMPPEQKAGAERVVASGSADEINTLLSDFKAGAGKGEENPAADPVTDEVALDGAEGVRSTGLRLPDEPKAGQNDFAKAWEEA